MRMRFYPAMKKRVNRSKFFFIILIMFATTCSVCFAGDVPIERDFLRLPHYKWIWLEKVGVHSTRIILGRGKKSFKNKIWSKVYETDGEHHTWAYAFFIKIKPKKFITFDQESNPQVAVSTYDMGNGVIRWAIIYRIKNNKLEIVKEVDGFNVAADESVYR